MVGPAGVAGSRGQTGDYGPLGRRDFVWHGLSPRLAVIQGKLMLIITVNLARKTG